MMRNIERPTIFAILENQRENLESLCCLLGYDLSLGNSNAPN